jgi:NADPH oxidase 5
LSDVNIDQRTTLFTQIAGEDKIIDRYEFKNALKVTGLNMSNRLFDIFDEDKSGALELDEFLNSVNYLQNGYET